MSAERIDLSLKAWRDASRDFTEVEGGQRGKAGGSRKMATWKKETIAATLAAADELSDVLRQKLEDEIQAGQVKGGKKVS